MRWLDNSRDVWDVLKHVLLCVLVPGDEGQKAGSLRKSSSCL